MRFHPRVEAILTTSADIGLRPIKGEQLCHEVAEYQRVHPQPQPVAGAFRESPLKPAPSIQWASASGEFGQRRAASDPAALPALFLLHDVPILSCCMNGLTSEGRR